MVESLRRSIGLQIARFRLRKSREKVISFTQSFSSARNALLILPMGSGEVFPAGMVVQLLKQKFTEDHITVVAGDRNGSLLELLQHSTVIRVPLTGLTTFYLPRREVLAHVTQRPYDLAIDLNLDLVLPSGYICKESNARVRVGFVSRRSDIFYNFQIQPDPTLNRQLIYDRLAKCLQMF